MIKMIPLEGNPKILYIFIDEHHVKTVHTSIFGKSPRLPNIPSLEEWLQEFDQLEYQRVKRYLLYRLSAQNFHSSKIRKILKERIVSSKTIDQVFIEFEQKGYIQDQEWIDSFFRQRLKRDSLKVISAKLKMRGIPQDEINDAYGRWKVHYDESEIIQSLLANRYKNKDLSEYKTKQKVIIALLRKGYQYDCIFESIRESLQKED